MKVTVNTVNFCGLWGNTSRVNNREQNKYYTHINDYEVKEYFPFADEALEALSNVQKQNSTYRTVPIDQDRTCFLHNGTNICIKSNLLFTAKQWFAYITNKLPKESVETKWIERNLKNIHLERYLRA